MTDNLHTLAANLWHREGGHCVSSLVHTLANGYGAVDGSRGAKAFGELSILTEQAFELSTPIDDWEEAAREAGWNKADDGWRKTTSYGHQQHPGPIEALCDVEDIEPYRREVFEHWIVSNWLADKLADKLAERGEKVDKDFSGLTIWARTTTGQAIAMDSVIEDICAELNK